ncbi:MAG: hypothetical protein ACREUT_20305 [Steroidobacteraceae bacterium]
MGVSRAKAEELVLDRTERAALSIIFSEFEGSIFNWTTMEFEERK